MIVIDIIIIIIISISYFFFFQRQFTGEKLNRVDKVRLKV